MSSPNPNDHYLKYVETKLGSKFAQALAEAVEGEIKAVTSHFAHEEQWPLDIACQYQHLTTKFLGDLKNYFVHRLEEEGFRVDYTPDFKEYVVPNTLEGVRMIKRATDARSWNNGTQGR